MTATRWTNIIPAPKPRGSPCTVSALRSPTEPCANPFYGRHFAKPDYYAFFSDPVNRRHSEPAVMFSASIAR